MPICVVLLYFRRDDDGGTDSGAFYVLFLDSAMHVKSHAKVSALSGGLTADLDSADHFGTSVTCLGDLNFDSVADVAVSSYLDDDGSSNAGALFIIYLSTEGTVLSHAKLSSLSGDFTSVLATDNWFGMSLAFLGDLNSDGGADLAVGTYGDNDAGTKRGAMYIVFTGLTQLAPTDAPTDAPTNAPTNALTDAPTDPASTDAPADDQSSDETEVLMTSDLIWSGASHLTYADGYPSELWLMALVVFVLLALE